jgi:hypothetical protein
VIKDVVAHPIGEGKMARNETWIFPARQQTGGLSAFGRIQEADCQVVQLVSRRSGPNLSGRDGITAEQKVLSAALNRKRVLNHLIDQSMAPGDVPLGRVAKHGQFSSFENPREFWLDQLANGGLTHSAGTGDEKEHRGNVR